MARGTTAGQGGEGADSRLGDRACGRQLRMQGWREGREQPSLPAGFLGGGALAGALPQGIFVVTAAAPAPDVPAADAAHARDAAAATGHVAAAHGAGPEAIAAAATGAADDSCGGTAGVGTLRGGARGGPSTPGTQDLLEQWVRCPPRGSAPSSGENSPKTASPMSCPCHAPLRPNLDDS